MNKFLNSKKHKATHCGYKSKPTKSQVRTTINFFDTSDLNQVFLNSEIVNKNSEIIKSVIFEF